MLGVCKGATAPRGFGMNRHVHNRRHLIERRRRHDRRRRYRRQAHLNFSRVVHRSKRFERANQKTYPRWWKRLRRSLMPFRPSPVHIAREAIEESARWTRLGPPDLSVEAGPRGPSPPLPGGPGRRAGLTPHLPHRVAARD